MTEESKRLQDPAWRIWGPYLSERQWGTVREDYSADGSAWEFTSHEIARSKAWRWGEDGLGGLADAKLQICIAVSLWNERDPILKERYFGLTGNQGNHGEDVKELYYFLDATPSHSYLKMLYKYPQAAYPYKELLDENNRRGKKDPEYEIQDTGIFNENRYFDVFIEYAKFSPEDILMKITVFNRGPEAAPLHVLPNIWFRNNWSLGYVHPKPGLERETDNRMIIQHEMLGQRRFYAENPGEILFCDNETNNEKCYLVPNKQDCYYKDGINNYILHGAASVNPGQSGTKAAFHFNKTIGAGESETFRLRMSVTELKNPFEEFESIFSKRIEEANAFYAEKQTNLPTEELKSIQRQAYAGMVWCKQLYYYNVEKWITGDPAFPPPPPQRINGRNHQWRHLNSSDIISMPDSWEYPWFAAWDLAFHCICFADLDVGFAKHQLTLLTHEWFMHPNGQLPAYEWAFSDVNPPVHAWATWKVYSVDKTATGTGDLKFLETIFLKLLMNFTWWVNRKDEQGNNIFEGGFLGMDNIGLFDRNSPLPDGSILEQSDSTSWMCMYSLNMMRIALELAKTNDVYQDMATKFFEHFLYIAHAMFAGGDQDTGLWDDVDEFYYDAIQKSDGKFQKLKIRSMVGLIPLLAVEILDDDLLKDQKIFSERLYWFLNNRPELAKLVSKWGEKGKDEKHLLSLLRGHRMKRILYRMLDASEFLSDHGLRALSKYHEANPFVLQIDGSWFSVQYTPGESDTTLFGGNSNWRGPVWMPMNYLIIDALKRFHDYYGDDFRIEYPTHSGNLFCLKEIADKLAERVITLFTRDANGNRPVFGDQPLFQKDPNFKDYIQFFEYFHGDSGKGLGASHQTGWTGLVARLLTVR
jgi:Glycosyl hydrolase family 63 C-terminal domain